MGAPLLALDTPWLLYRSFYALPASITGSGGTPVNALLGTLNTILALIDWRTPRAVVCCFGAEQADYRVALYPPYHAHRPSMPDDLARQFEQAPGLLEAFGWTVASDTALEADDLLGSFARVEGGPMLVCSADRDLYQLVTEEVHVVVPRGAGEPEVIDEAGVRSRAGVAPAQIPDLIALRGDPSDGLPGARGIGAKTAAALLAAHGTLEGVLTAPAGALRPRLAATLREQDSLLRAFRDVATLREIDVVRPPDGATDRARGGAAAEQLGMGRLATRLRES